jgi:hypothetical protein
VRLGAIINLRLRRNMDVNSITPATKPQPVVILGAIIAGITTIISGLVVILKDNPTAILALGIAGVVVAGVSVFKDQIVKAQVVPLKDTVAYVNDQRAVITGPAAPAGSYVTGSALVLEDPPLVTPTPVTPPA